MRCVELMADGEVRFHRNFRELVPWANELAVIASVDAIAHGLAKFERNRAAQLDGEIRDAAPRVELVRSDDRLSRADIDAGAACAAVSGRGCIDGQR